MGDDFKTTVSHDLEHLPPVFLRLLGLTRLDELLEEFRRRGAFHPPLRRPPSKASVVSATPAPATPARVAPVAQAVPVEAQLAEAAGNGMSWATEVD